MRFSAILTPARTRISAHAAALLAALCTAFTAPPATAQTDISADAPADAGALLDMREAFRRGDKARLSALLPLTRGHALEAWAAYWELKARLEDATEDEVQAFLTRWQGTYQEDRLRNDWLLLAGKRRDWASFSAHLPAFRMRDDAQVRCYDLAARLSRGQAPDAEALAQLQTDWLAQRNADDGCLLAADLLHASGHLPNEVLWLKARQAVQDARPALARTAAALAAPAVDADTASLLQDPRRWLLQRAALPAGGTQTAEGQQLALLALLKLATQTPDQAIELLQQGWAARLPAPLARQAWALAGKWAGIKQPDLAWLAFNQANQDTELSDHLLAWKARAALRQGQWAAALAAINAMRQPEQDDGAWLYWRARAQLALAQDDNARAAAEQALHQLAQHPSRYGFYEKLAREALGQPLHPPPAPAPLSADEREAARLHPGLNRALLAIHLGLRSEGVREWNYWTSLHTPGGMPDRQLYAAADMACRFEVWDRCIQTSKRIRGFMDLAQRFPTPHRQAVLAQAQASGLEAAYMYGLIRQESRFVTDARSTAGASGLMQIMPATARWTARKIGLQGFATSQLNELHTNLLIGASYLKLALDDFQQSMPLAAAAYNAGPGRPRNWRNGPDLEGAIWVENIPFTETRDYVKKVLSNTVDYAQLLAPPGAPLPGLQQRLGRIAPLPPDALDPSVELP